MLLLAASLAVLEPFWQMSHQQCLWVQLWERLAASLLLALLTWVVLTWMLQLVLTLLVYAVRLVGCLLLRSRVVLMLVALPWI